MSEVTLLRIGVTILGVSVLLLSLAFFLGFVKRKNNQ